MKNQTVDKLWNVMICVGLGGLVVFFSLLFSMFLLIAQGDSARGFTMLESLAICSFCLLAPFVMLQLSQSLELISFDLHFLTKKNVQIILISTVFVIILSFVESLLLDQQIIVEEATDPLVSQFLSKVPPVILVLFIFISVPIMEEVVFRGGIIGLIFKDKPLLGVLISSMIYCLISLPEGIFSWLSSFIINLVLGLSYIKTKQLEVPILIKMIATLFTIP